MLYTAEPKLSLLVQVQSNNSNSENEDFFIIICHDKLLLGCYNTIVKKVYI